MFSKIIFGLILISLSEAAMCWPPPREADDRDYDRYLQKCLDDSGHATISSRILKNAVRFTVESDSQDEPHCTCVKAELYCTQDDGQERVIAEKTLNLEHIREETTIASDQYYLDEDGALYLPSTRIVKFTRPTITRLNLDTPLSYVRSQSIMGGHANVFGLSIKLDGEVISDPESGYYQQREVSQTESSPYIYSTGSALFVVRGEDAVCDLINRTSKLAFSYAVPTGHELTVRPNCTLNIESGDMTLSFPYSILDKGVYKYEDGLWEQVGNDLKPLSDKTLVHIGSAVGPIFQTLKVQPMGETNLQVLSDLRRIPYPKHIYEIDFNGLEFSSHELQELVALLNAMPLLEALNLSTETNCVDYSAIVPILEQLTLLKKLDITNCGINDDALGNLRQRPRLQIINPAAIVGEEPEQPESTAETAAPAPDPVQPPPQVVAFREEEFDGGTDIKIAPNSSEATIYKVTFKRVVHIWSDGSETIKPWGDSILTETRKIFGFPKDRQGAELQKHRKLKRPPR